MSVLSTILNVIHVPWPDADSGKVRDAAKAWTALGTAAAEAGEKAGAAARQLADHNTGHAMDAFNQFWDNLGGPYNACTLDGKTALLPLLTEACGTLADACERYAAAIDKLEHDLKHKAEELGLVVGAGTLAGIFTAGLSELAVEAVSGPLTAAATVYLGEFAEAVVAIVNTILEATVFTVLDAVFDTTLRSVAGDNQSGIGALLSVFETSAEAGAGGAVGSLAGDAVKAAANGALEGMPDDVAALLPDLPALLAGTPGALDTVPGKALQAMIGEYATNRACNPDATQPDLTDILADLLEAKIEATVAPTEHP